MLLGQNPCNVDMIFGRSRRFGNWGREGGGVSGIEIALMDLIGKVYGVPCYQLLGGKYRDKVRLYGDTPTPDDPTPEDFVKAVKGAARPRPHLDQVRPAVPLFETGDNPLIGHDDAVRIPSSTWAVVQDADGRPRRQADRGHIERGRDVSRRCARRSATTCSSASIISARAI